MRERSDAALPQTPFRLYQASRSKLLQTIDNTQLVGTFILARIFLFGTKKDERFYRSSSVKMNRFFRRFRRCRFQTCKLLHELLSSAVYVFLVHLFEVRFSFLLVFVEPFRNHIFSNAFLETWFITVRVLHSS